MGKNSFVMYTDWHPVIKALSDEDAGKLFKALYDYQMGKDTSIDEPITSGIYEMITNRFDVDGQKYQEKCEKNRENGAKGGRPKKETERFSEKANGFFQNPKKANGFFQNPNDNDNDNDNDINLKENVKRKAPPPAKKKYGEHQKVLLTDEQYQRLTKEFGDVQTKRAIEFLDGYIADKGYKSKDNYLAICRWVFDALREQDEKRKKKSGSTFNHFPQNSYDYSELEGQLLDN